MTAGRGALTIAGLHVSYGAAQVLRGVTLEVGHGEAVAVVGPNGAGKTTLLRAISGLVPAQQGTIDIGGERVNGRRPFAITRAGFSHVPEGRGTLASMTVEENLLVAANRAMSRHQRADKVREMLELFDVLGRLRTRTAGLLSGGEQQMLAIARGLMAEPKILAVDEPSMGLAPRIVNELVEMLRAVVDRGISLLLVEQNTSLAARVATRTYVLVRGQIEAEGDTSEISTELMETFLA